MSTVSEVRLCDTCLVSGRSVAPLGSLRHVFAALTDCIADTESLLACWECIALLRRAARFRLRAERVQFCLQTAIPLDSLDVESGSSLCAVGPVAEVHIHQETEDEQLADIKCEYDSEGHSDSASAHLEQDTLEEQIYDSKVKPDPENYFDVEYETEENIPTKCENETGFYTMKSTMKDLFEYFEEKRKCSDFKTAKYKCDECVIVLNIQNYKKHQTLHENTDKVICRLCKIRLNTKRALQRHLEKHDLKYQCSSCPFTTKSVYLMHYHICKQHLESDTTSREEAERKNDMYSTSGRTYKCDQCEETFMYLCNLIKHSQSHNIREFTCTECDFAAETEELLETHTQQDHGQTQEHYPKYREPMESQSTTERTFTCETCKRPFRSAKSLQEHVYRYHKYGTMKVRGRPSVHFSVMMLSEEEMWKYREQEANSLTFKYAKWKCEKCIMIFNNKLNFSRHERLHSLKLHFICKICTMPIRTSKALEEHTETHYTMYKCMQCDYTSFRRISEYHYEIHNKPNNGFQCKICEKWFQQWAEKNAHVKEHKDLICSVKDVPNIYECDKCSNRFSSKKRIERHLLIHERKYECSVCPYRASCSGNLSSHYKRHHLMAPVLNEVYCVKCKKQYLTEEAYNVHVSTVHNKVMKKFPCTTCDKLFSTNVALKNHTNFYHLKQRNFVCQFCNKNLCKKGSLKMHIKRVHEGLRKPKNHMCTFCNQGFSTRRVLIHHVRTHTGERPYNCEYCNASFAQASAMKIHVRNIHLKLAANQRT